MRIKGACRAFINKLLQTPERKAIDLEQLPSTSCAVGKKLHVVLDAVECNGHPAVTKADLCALKVFVFTIRAHAGHIRRALNLSLAWPLVKRNARLADILHGREELRLN